MNRLQLKINLFAKDNLKRSVHAKSSLWGFFLGIKSTMALF